MKPQASIQKKEDNFQGTKWGRFRYFSQQRMRKDCTAETNALKERSKGDKQAFSKVKYLMKY